MGRFELTFDRPVAFKLAARLLGAKCKRKEKGGRFHEVPAHRNAESYLDAFVSAAGIDGDLKGPLFARDWEDWRLVAQPYDPQRRTANGETSGSERRDQCQPYRLTHDEKSTGPMEKLEELHIRRVLARARSLGEAARVLGLDPATLWRRRRKYGIESGLSRLADSAFASSAPA